MFFLALHDVRTSKKKKEILGGKVIQERYCFNMTKSRLNANNVNKIIK